MRSFVKIKSSQNCEITLSFIDFGKSGPSREKIIVANMSFNAIGENKNLEKISEFTVLSSLLIWLALNIPMLVIVVLDIYSPFMFSADPEPEYQPLEEGSSDDEEDDNIVVPGGPAGMFPAGRGRGGHGFPGFQPGGMDFAGGGMPLGGGRGMPLGNYYSFRTGLPG